MSCCDGLTIVKTEGIQLTYNFPAKRVDLTNYSATLRVSASEGATVLLTVAGIVTATTVVFYSPPATVQAAIPNATPISDPWVGVFEADVTSPSNVVSRIDSGTFIAEKGV